MRDLQECQAEVFRRSNNRIQARKKRCKKMVLACAPLVLCVVVLAAVLPGKMPEAVQQPTPSQDAVPGTSQSVQHSQTDRGSSVTVSGPNVWYTLTEEADVQMIYNQLLAYSPQSSESTLLGRPEIEGEQAVNCGTSDPCYTITLDMGKDGSTVYTLTGSCLQNLTGDWTCTLTQVQQMELQELLGIG